MHKNNLCPVCGFPFMEDPYIDDLKCLSFEICPSCGVQFGHDDLVKTHPQLRDIWLNGGMKWSSSMKEPAIWNEIKETLKEWKVEKLSEKDT